MPVLTRRKLKADNLPQAPGVLNRLVYRRGTQLLGPRHEAILIPWRRLAVPCRDCDNPALPFQRQEQSTAPVLRDLGQAQHAFPILRSGLGYGEDGSGIGEVDADRRFFRQRPANRLEQTEG